MKKPEYSYTYDQFEVEIYLNREGDINVGFSPTIYQNGKRVKTFTNPSDKRADLDQAIDMANSWIEKQNTN